MSGQEDGNVRTCSGPRCDATVRWVLTERGNRMPLDLEPDPEGNVYAVRLAGGIVRARVLGASDVRPDGVTFYRPHWTTCPDADTFKRRAAAKVPRCSGCRQPMDPVLAAGGDLYHPTCAPTGLREHYERAKAAAAATDPDDGQDTLL